MNSCWVGGVLVACFVGFSVDFLSPSQKFSILIPNSCFVFKSSRIEVTNYDAPGCEYRDQGDLNFPSNDEFQDYRSMEGSLGVTSYH